MDPNLRLTSSRGNESDFSAAAAYSDGREVHILYQFTDGRPGGDYYWAEVDGGGQPVESTIVRPRRDMNFQSISQPVYVFGRPGSPQAGWVYTAPSGAAPPMWYAGWPYLKDGWPLDSQGRPLTAKSVATARYAGGTSVEAEYNPPPTPQSSREFASMNGMKGAVRWLTAIIRVWTDLRDPPPLPKTTGTLDDDFAAHYRYREALLVHTTGNKLIDTLTRLLEDALLSGAQLRDPSPELLGKIKPFLRDGIGALLLLRDVPKQPPIVHGDAAANLRNLNRYSLEVNTWAEETDFGDSASELLGMVIEQRHQLAASATHLLT
jgi:hypothetical protein